MKKLQRAGIKSRINELRDFYGTWLVRNGVIKEEQDLLCGRISQSIFVRCYFSPAINDLKARVLSAISYWRFRINQINIVAILKSWSKAEVAVKFFS